MARTSVLAAIVCIVIYLVSAAKKPSGSSGSSPSYSGSSPTVRRNPTPRPTPRPTSSERQIYVGYNITALDFDDLADLDSSAEQTAFKTSTVTGMRSAFRDSDPNFDDLNGNSDPDKWAISIDQMIVNTEKGTVGLDVEIEVYWTVKDDVVNNQNGKTGQFENNMQEYYRSFFNDTDIMFNVDESTLTTESGSESIALYSSFMIIFLSFFLC